MSRTISVTLYAFEELSDNAKSKALDAYRALGMDYMCVGEYRDSRKAFLSRFNVTATDWSIGTCSYSYIKTDADQKHFRGMKLRDFDRDHMPTGVYSDCTLWMTFYDSFKKTGDAKQAFADAIDAHIKAEVADMEHETSDEYIIEHFEANNYEFTEKGAIA